MSASFIVIPRAHSHPESLMSLLNVKFTPFPSLLSSPSASPSRTSGPHKKLVSIPDAPARWRESCRLTDSAPNKDNELKFANFSNYTDREHNPIDIPNNNPRFRVLRRRHHDFRQCKRYAESRSIKLQPQSRSKQSFVPVLSYSLTGNRSRSCVKSF